MDPRIIQFDASAEFSTDEGCDIIESSNSEADPELSIAQARVAPGVTTQWHCVVDTAERYVILQGRGRVEVGEVEAREVGKGDVVLIPPSVRQRISNIGDSDLLFLALCTPRFEQRNYRDLEHP